MFYTREQITEVERIANDPTDPWQPEAIKWLDDYHLDLMNYEAPETPYWETSSYLPVDFEMRVNDNLHHLDA